MSGFQQFASIAYAIFVVYCFVLLIFYVVLPFFSFLEVRDYVKKKAFLDYNGILQSGLVPPLTVIAPAYNESKTIIENISSLMKLNYPDYEVLIINDGSRDDTLQKVILAYNLKRIKYNVSTGHIKTQTIRGIYKSDLPGYEKLLVIDKVNGGKADALNVGINYSRHRYITCIDVDCILETDSLLKMIRHFLEQTGKRVIASGGVIRIANSCIVEDGRLVKVVLPKEFLPRMQALEYIRVFLLGRMAWSRLNGLFLISGAFGTFDKDIVRKVGGYSTKTVGEDMELVVRMRRYMEDQQIPYAVTYVPEPLCWTEAPNTFQVLGRQRNRWMRGTIETLSTHRKLLFNPRYRLLGLLSFPFIFFYEFLAPMVQFIAFVTFGLMALFGLLSWQSVLLSSSLILMTGYIFSFLALTIEVYLNDHYHERTDILNLIGAALIEPFVFHPFLIWAALLGNVDILRKKGGWGEMTRQGFTTKKR
jgi:cellulose synthase/poly-beta-1,6-N-acetylglucosamine synthase-like glycosyltransferase